MFGEDVESLSTFGSIMNKEQVQAYLDETIEHLGSYVLTQTDRKQIDRDITDFIIRKIDRKRFRRKLTDTNQGKDTAEDKRVGQKPKATPLCHSLWGI